MQLPDWQTPLNRIISPSEADLYAKTTGRNEYIVGSADRVAHIDGQLSAIIVEKYTRASSGEYKCLKK